MGSGSMLRLIYAYLHRQKDTNSHVAANKIICVTNAFTNSTAIVLDVYYYKEVILNINKKQTYCTKNENLQNLSKDQ